MTAQPSPSEETAHLIPVCPDLSRHLSRRYGEFQNVFLSGEECTRLEAAYPGKAAEYIERLSRYMASNDRHYANHYATIKKWLDEDSKGRSAKNYTYDDNEGECL